MKKMRSLSSDIIRKAAQHWIKGIEEKQLSNPVLREDLQMYWKGQWDGIHGFLHELDIEVKQRP